MNQGFSEEEDDIDFGRLLRLTLENWKLFVVSVPFAVFLSYAYIWYAHPIYKMEATVLVEDETADISQSLLDEVGMFGKKRNIENEIAILQSRSLMEKALSILDLELNYMVYRGLRKRELYQNSPFELEYTILENGPKSFVLDLVFHDDGETVDLEFEYYLAGVDSIILLPFIHTRTHAHADKNRRVAVEGTRMMTRMTMRRMRMRTRKVEERKERRRGMKRRRRRRRRMRMRRPRRSRRSKVEERGGEGDDSVEGREEESEGMKVEASLPSSSFSFLL